MVKPCFAYLWALTILYIQEILIYLLVLCIVLLTLASTRGLSESIFCCLLKKKAAFCRTDGWFWKNKIYGVRRSTQVVRGARCWLRREAKYVARRTYGLINKIWRQGGKEKSDSKPPTEVTKRDIIDCIEAAIRKDELICPWCPYLFDQTTRLVGNEKFGAHPASWRQKKEKDISNLVPRFFQPLEGGTGRWLRWGNVLLRRSLEIREKVPAILRAGGYTKEEKGSETSPTLRHNPQRSQK